MTLSPIQKDRINDKFLSIEMWVERIKKLIDKDFHVMAKSRLDEIIKYSKEGRRIVEEKE